MKTKEELNALKEEVETVSRKLHELTDEELAQVSGGEEKTECEHGRTLPIDLCKRIGCTHLSGHYCTFFQKEIYSGGHGPHVV